MTDPSPQHLVFQFPQEDGFHRFSKEQIALQIEKNVPAVDQDEAWNSAARAWLEHLRQDLGAAYAVHDLGKVLLLAPGGAQFQNLGKIVESCVNRVDQHLSHLMQVTGGKRVVLIFATPEDYFRYVSYHSPDGEQSASGGMCIAGGYPHIVLFWTDPISITTILVHELTHETLAGLSMPSWLHEAVAVTAEKAMAPAPRHLGQTELDSLYSASINWRAPVMWDELAEEHFALWNEQNIQEFWAGTSFFAVGNLCTLSYSLAEVLLQLISQNYSAAQILAFVQEAHWAMPDNQPHCSTSAKAWGNLQQFFLGQGTGRLASRPWKHFGRSGVGTMTAARIIPLFNKFPQSQTTNSADLNKACSEEGSVELRKTLSQIENGVLFPLGFDLDPWRGKEHLGQFTDDVAMSRISKELRPV
jgi:hypothetical protein